MSATRPRARAADSTDVRDALTAALDASLDFLGSLEQRPVGATVDAGTLRARLDGALPTEGTDAAQVVRELVAAVEGGLLASTGGRFFGWVIGGTLPAAVAADWLTSVWDNNAALSSTSPAAAVVEEVAGQWLKALFDLPPHASVGLVSGCQMAHFTCLAAARHAVLARHGWDVAEQGCWGAQPVRVLCTRERHGAIDRALRFLGFGRSDVTALDPAGDWERALRDSAPTIVVLQAGEINTGAFDPFERLIPLATQRGAWVHVDGAFGLWAAASPRYRHLLRGVDAADSWATDGHKWLNTPFDCGYAFVADPAAHRAAMAFHASYITHATTTRDEMDWNPEWSRRARGFPTYAALRQLGRRGVADLIERCCRHAHTLVTEIGRLPGAECLAEPILNQGLVRFIDPHGREHDRRTDAVIAEINRTGEAFFTGTTWRGQRAMRVSVCSWRTSDDDVQRAIDCVRSVLATR